MVIYDLEWRSHQKECSSESLTFENQYVHIILKIQFVRYPNASAKFQKEFMSSSSSNFNLLEPQPLQKSHSPPPILLIDMLIPFLLRPTLQQHHPGQKQYRIQRHHPKHGRENHIQKAIREITKRPYTPLRLRRDKRIRARRVRDEGVGKVSTAIEFLLQQRLDFFGLELPVGGEIAASTERLEPDVEADDQGGDAAGDHHVAVESEPDFVGGEKEAGEGDKEGDEYEDGVNEPAWIKRAD